MLHPATGMPIFAEPSEVSCFHTAQQEMVRLRMGLGSQLLRRNDSLNAMLAGLHPSCQTEGWGLACPATWQRVAWDPSPAQEMSLFDLEEVRIAGEWAR